MKKHLAIILLGAALMAACRPQEEPSLRTGDLIFIAAQGDMNQAIATSTGSITHVAIVLCTDSGAYAVDATPGQGVAATPLDDYLQVLQQQNVRLLIQRPDFRFDTMRLHEQVARTLGCPYDSAFLPNNEAYYCSELVQTLLRDSAGNELIHSRPMNFLDTAGMLPTFWKQWFERLSLPVPQDTPGTNPHDLYLFIIE